MDRRSSQQNATLTTIKNAQALVAAAQESVAAYNSFRMDNLRRNTQKSKKQQSPRVKKDEVTLPILSDKVLSAAALLAEIDSGNKHRNGTLYKTYPRDEKLNPFEEKRATPSSFWMEKVDESKGTQPYGGNSTYKVRGTRYLPQFISN
jgi:hypothetical protein